MILFGRNRGRLLVVVTNEVWPFVLDINSLLRLHNFCDSDLVVSIY